MVDFLDDDQDEEFPLGDGTAETDAVITCPYCGERGTFHDGEAGL